MHTVPVPVEFLVIGLIATSISLIERIYNTFFKPKSYNPSLDADELGSQESEVPLRTVKQLSEIDKEKIKNTFNNKTNSIIFGLRDGNISVDEAIGYAIDLDRSKYGNGATLRLFLAAWLPSSVKT